MRPRRAQEEPQAPSVPNIREVAPGQYEIGLIHLDQKAQTLSFPGALNLNQGLMEYLIVTPEGSTHESLLVTDARPTDVQFAMLLLGAKGSGALERTGNGCAPATDRLEVPENGASLERRWRGHPRDVEGG